MAHKIEQERIDAMIFVIDDWQRELRGFREVGFLHCAEHVSEQLFGAEIVLSVLGLEELSAKARGARTE